VEKFVASLNSKLTGCPRNITVEMIAALIQRAAYFASSGGDLLKINVKTTVC
jgi:hypothetical protein